MSAWPGARAGLLLCLVSTAPVACAPAEPVECLDAAAAPRGEAALHLIAAAAVDGGVRVRGFSGAAAAGSELSVATGPRGTSVRADQDGRFDTFIAVEPRPEVVSIHALDEGWSAEVRVRDLESAHRCLMGPARPVGTTPNDLVLGRCGERLSALVPTSGDGALERVSFGAKDSGAVSFAVDAEGRGASPWSVALQQGTRLAAVTLFGQHAVALLEPCEDRLLDVAPAALPSGEPLLVDVAPPLELTGAIDADGDGEDDATVSRMLPRHPEGVAFAGDRLFVTFTNLLEVGPPARFGPGLLVAYAVEGERLVPAGHQLLPYQNPQAVIVGDDGGLWVSCSGVLERRDGKMSAISEGGLVHIEPQSLAIVHTVALDDFAPGTPALLGEHIVVGSLLSGSVLRLSRESTSLGDGQLLFTAAAGTESVFDVTPLGGGLAVFGEFTTDSLHVVDVPRGELHPWPFERPLLVGTGDAVFRGLQAVAVAPARGGALAEPDAAALLGLSSEVVPLSFWQVLGP